MNKLKLDPELLLVESFTPEAWPKDGTGTVRGQSFVTLDFRPCGSDDPSAQCVQTDYHWYTCGYSCVNKCVQTAGIPTCDA